MKPVSGIILLFLITSLLISCVSQKEYALLEETVDYYKEEALKSDSLQNAYRQLSESNRQTEAQFRTAIRELEQLTATNLSLNRSYQNLLQEYNSLISQNQEVLTTTAYEKGSLQEQLASQQSELDEKRKDLANLDFELYQKQAQLTMKEYDFNALEGSLSNKNQRIQELEAMLNLKEEAMRELRQRMNEALTGFSNTDLSVDEKNGKLYVTLSQELLFPSGSTVINWKGKKAIGQLAGVLKKNPDMDILVEGHTDTDGSADKNWKLSTERAIAVVNVLTSNGVNPDKITAAGRAFYEPVASNDTPQGKAFNRRTEIILSPNLDELFEIINR